MGVKSTHPDYTKMEGKWIRTNDSFLGSDAIKGKTEEYLPPTQSMIEDGFRTSMTSEGYDNYKALLVRALYPDEYKEAVKANMGQLHRKIASFDLPESMEYLRENATRKGESLQLLLAKINLLQLKSGRCGLLVDIDEDTGHFYISIYNELSIRNWNSTTSRTSTANPSKSKIDVKADSSVVVLDESSHVMDDDLKWKENEKYLVVALGDESESGFTINPTQGVYAIGACEGTNIDNLSNAQWKVPKYLGSPLECVPFVFINSSDLSPSPDNPPLLGLADLCLAIYRGEADYRQGLFAQGNATLVTIGENQQDSLEIDRETGKATAKKLRTGTGARIQVPLNGDAKYISVDATGLSEQRSCLENDYKKAAQRSGIALQDTGSSQQSGEALRIRSSSQTATLPQMADTGAAGLEKALRFIAMWLKEKPEDVNVTPNKDFIDEIINGGDLGKIVDAKLNGFPVSWKSLHQYGKDQGLSKMDYDAEMAEINNEIPIGLDI